MPKRAAEDDEWELHKDDIVKLYRDENKPLPQVMDLMVKESGFKRTKAQYERNLQKWKIKKYSKSEEWKFIAHRYHERDVRGLRTSVEVRGVLVSREKLKKEVARYGYQTTMERITSEVSHRQRSETPHGVRVFTPVRSPSPLNLELMECIPSPSSRHVEISMSWSDEVFFYLAERTPWHSFTQVIHSLNTNGSLQLLFPSSREASGCQQGSFNSMDASNELEVVHGLGNSFLTRWLDDILFAFHITDLVESSIPVECINPRPYLPPKEGLPDIDVEAITDLSTKSTQLEFLKLAAHLLSNNFDVAHVSSVIVELAQDKRNRALLRSLLDQKLLVADAMAEKLLIPAVRGKNIPLINLLLEADCDINMETLLPGLGNPSSALECATAQNSEDIVTFLLDNGANGNVPRRLVISYGLGVYVWFESLLDAAVYRGNISMARELLKPRPKFRHGCPKITIDTFRIAMVSNKIETILFLLKRDPTLNELIRSQPWSFLEVAALQKTSSLFSHLEQYGLDINQTDNLGMGSPLAAASASGNLTLVRHLCERNASLSSVNSRLPQALLTPLSFSYSGKCSLGSLGGMAALHTAICNQDEQMVEFLLSKGAEINQCCYPEDTYGTHLPVFPIQLATYYENTVIVNMLLDAGADPDATMGPTLGSTVGIIKVHGFIQITGRSALRIALERGNEIIFDRLLQCGAIMPTDPTHVDSWDPLISASRGGNPNLLRRIFKVSKLKNDTIHISLTECILHFDSGLAKKMLRSLELSSVPSKYIYRRDVIRAAVESGDADLVHSLLKNAKASMGRLPAGYGATGFVAAMRNRHFGMISLFLSVGIKPYDVDVDEYELEERDALAVAIGGTDEPTIPPEQLELLINASTEPITGSHEHDLWRSSLFFACKWAIVQYPEFLSMIVAKGINVNWAPPGDNTLLQYAIQCSAIHLRIEHTNDQSPLEFLLHCGADIHAPASYSHGATALQYAAMKGNFEILNKLLKAGANINEPCGLYQGRTAIEGAAEHGRLNMASYLLEAGADIKGRTNRNYRRTIYRAWKEGHRALAQMVQNWKRHTYGDEDCEDIEVIVQSVTEDELNFASPAAKLEYEKLPDLEDEEDLEQLFSLFLAS